MLSRNRFKHRLGFLAAVFSALVVVENCHALDLSTICARRDFEFSANVYMAQVGSVSMARVWPAHLNVVCMDDSTMAASIYDPIRPVIALTNASVVKGVLNLSQISMAPGDRNLVPSTSTLSRLHLDLMSYVQDGQIVGTFLNQNMEGYLAVTGEIPFIVTGQRNYANGSLPRTEDWAPTTVDPMQAVGIYHFPIPAIVNPISKEKIPASTGTLIYDVGEKTFTPAIYLRMEGHYQYHLVQGAAWDSTGRFQMSTAFNDMTPVGAPFGQIRGHFVDNKTIEFFLIDPIWGVRGAVDSHGNVTGPFTATMVSSEAELLKAKRTHAGPTSQGVDNRPKLPVMNGQSPAPSQGPNSN